MRKRWRILLSVMLAGLAVLMAALWILQAALRHVPRFYQQESGSAGTDRAHDGVELERSLVALHNDTHVPGTWSAVFTEQQLNGWLAVELPAKFPELLPEGWEEPRVAVVGDQLQVACRYVGGPLTTILNLQLEVSLADEPNTLAVRLRSLHAGRIPLPLKRILDAVSEAAERADLPLRWAQTGGDPVALVALSDSHPQAEELRVTLQRIELSAGEVRVAGISTPRDDPPPGTADAVLPAPADGQPAENRAIQP